MWFKKIKSIYLSIANFSSGKYLIIWDLKLSTPFIIFICTDLNKNTHTLLAREKVSHFEWIDNDTIVVWCRNNSKI